MSANDKKESVATQVKEDGLNDKEKVVGDGKTETSPQKRTASELNNDEEVKHKHLKTDHKDDHENGTQDKYDEDGEEDEDDAVPDDYDEEGEDGEEGEDAPDEEDEDDDEGEE